MLANATAYNKLVVAATNAAERVVAAGTRERPSGCGRVYVTVLGPHRRKVAAAAKRMGRIVIEGGTIYVGYDNHDGSALAQGTAFAETLKAAGVTCYRDERED